MTERKITRPYHDDYHHEEGWPDEIDCSNRDDTGRRRLPDGSYEFVPQIEMVLISLKSKKVVAA